MNNRFRRLWYTAVGLAVVIVVAAVALVTRPNMRAQIHDIVAPNSTGANDVVDPGTSMDGRPAPNFTLTDQFGKQVSLSDFKGKVVVLAFVDSECTTICPLTTESMMRAMQMIGPQAAKNVQLLGIDANPQAISVADVKQYSEDHHMMNSWHFLTGSVSQLKSMWKNYDIYDQIVGGAIDHTPALYIIDPNGKEQYVFMTPPQYAAVDAQAGVVAQQVAKLLPSSVRPKLKNVSYHAPGFGLSKTVQLPVYDASSHGSTNTSSEEVAIGPGHPQLLAFFASWVPGVQQDLKSLDTYAASTGAPDVVGIDVLTTEPHNAPDAALLNAVNPKHYPIALDKTGDLTDAYGATDLMWLELTDGHGHIIWSHDGWLPVSQMTAKVQAALQQNK